MIDVVLLEHSVGFREYDQKNVADCDFKIINKKLGHAEKCCVPSGEMSISSRFIPI